MRQNLSKHKRFPELSLADVANINVGDGLDTSTFCKIQTFGVVECFRGFDKYFFFFTGQTGNIPLKPSQNIDLDRM